MLYQDYCPVISTNLSGGNSFMLAWVWLVEGGTDIARQSFLDWKGLSRWSIPCFYRWYGTCYNRSIFSKILIIYHVIRRCNCIDVARCQLCLDIFRFALIVNSFWPSDTIWRHRSGSKLAQVMTWCRMAPSHYLKQCWCIRSKVQWHSSKGNFTWDTSAINH